MVAKHEEIIKFSFRFLSLALKLEALQRFATPHNITSHHTTPHHTTPHHTTLEQVGAEETHYFRSADYARAMECNDADRRLIAATATLAVQKATQRQVIEEVGVGVEVA